MRPQTLAGLFGLFILSACATLSKKEAVLDYSVESVAPVVLETPAVFWRNGQRIETRDVVMVSLRVSNPADFRPRASEPPVFVVNEVISRFLLVPGVDDRAVVIAPHPASDDPITVFLMPWMPAEQLTVSALERLQENEWIRSRRARVSVPKDAVTVNARDEAELGRRAVLQPREPER